MNDKTNPMQEALAEARKAASCGEVPIGAVLVDAKTGSVVARAHNLTETQNDPTAHAEILAIRRRCEEVGAPRLPDHDLYVTLEPCAMCAAAIAGARLRRVYFGAYDPKGGGVEHGARIFTQPTTNHAPEIYGGIDEDAAAKILV
ncbi:MAG: nucleoside deaminase, partial [Alphaproteobacteria bacterium]|nr:nucleoside deaminase [Alphaproteobacteria bacterium]